MVGKFATLRRDERGATAVEYGLIVSLIAAVAAAWGIYAIGRKLHGNRAGFMLVALAAVGFGPCVSAVRKLNVPALRASQTLTRSIRPSKPPLRL